MSHYKSYPAYKDSGVEWIGQVPEHWKIAQLKRLLSIQNGSDHKAVEAEIGIPVYGSGGIFAYANDYIYDGESVLLGRKGTIDKPLYVNEKFWTVDTMYWSKIMPNADGKFCYYVATTIPFNRYSTNTALPSMTQTDLGSHVVTFPDKNEQKSISFYLDQETTRIDTLIAKKNRFIELLKEKRQALITHLVTKGLNPDVPMKDSGVEWIGQVPEHWKVTKLKYIANSLIGLTYSPNDVVSDDSGVLVLRSSNIQNGELSLKDCVRVNTNVPKNLTTQDGDILICSRNGSRELIGKNIQLDSRTKGATFGAFMTVIRSHVNDFLYFIFNSTMFKAQSDLFMTSTVNQLTISMLDNMKVAIPSDEELGSLVNYLRIKSNQIDSLMDKTQHSIELLKERRSAFITAAVTGQIDLRGASDE